MTVGKMLDYQSPEELEGKSVRRYPPMIDRLLASVDTSSDGGCWEWTASCNDDGYGHLRVNGKLPKVHRLVYENFVGPIATGQVVRHRCDNPPCARPTHLVIGTSVDNAMDTVERGRHFQASKTHCANGHPYDGDNLVTQVNGDRGCRTCNRDKSARHRERKRLGLS